MLVLKLLVVMVVNVQTWSAIKAASEVWGGLRELCFV